MPVDLYRVGNPSIGETWPARFRANRSTGGLGTGIYAFRTESAAKRNEDANWTNDGLYRLENALKNPIEPRTMDATDNLVKLSRVLSLLVQRVRFGDMTFDRAYDRGPHLRYSLTGGLTGDPGFGEGRSVGALARDVLFNTPELRDRHGYSTDAFVHDAYQSAAEADARIPADASFWQYSGLQPINLLLYPQWDGVAPLSGAGGDTGKHGCVVLKQRVDKCVGRDTTTFEEVDADVLNACWGDGGV